MNYEHERSEPRIQLKEYQFKNFFLKEQAGQEINCMLIDYSNSGYRLLFLGEADIMKGQPLYDTEGESYVVAWKDTQEEGLGTFGIQMLKSQQTHRMKASINDIANVADEIKQGIDEITANQEFVGTKDMSLDYYCIGLEHESLKEMEFERPSIILHDGKMKDVLPNINSYSNRFAIIATEDPRWGENLKNVLKMFAKTNAIDYTHEKVYTHSKTRHQVVDYLMEKYPDLPTRIASRANLVLEEMLMNGFYDAPTDARGFHKYASVSRKEEVVLSEEEAVNLKMGDHDGYLWLKVRDAFGSFPPAILLRYLKKCLAGGENMIDSKAGGAGLGLYMIWKSTYSMHLRIQKDKYTEFICTHKMRQSKEKSTSSCLMLSVE